MQIDIESNLHKLREEKNVSGTLSIRYPDRIAKLFHLTTQDNSVYIKAQEFFISLDSQPILSQIIEPRHRAMIKIYSEEVFTQVQRFYEKTNPQPRHPHALANISIRQRELRSIHKRKLTIDNADELREFEALLGKEEDQAWEVRIPHSRLLHRVMDKMGIK